MKHVIRLEALLLLSKVNSNSDLYSSDIFLTDSGYVCFSNKQIVKIKDCNNVHKGLDRYINKEDLTTFLKMLPIVKSKRHLHVELIEESYGVYTLKHGDIQHTFVAHQTDFHIEYSRYKKALSIVESDFKDGISSLTKNMIQCMSDLTSKIQSDNLGVVKMYENKKYQTKVKFQYDGFDVTQIMV